MPTAPPDLPLLVHRVVDALRGAMRISDTLAFDGTQWSAGAQDGVHVVVTSTGDAWSVNVAGAQLTVEIERQDGGGFSHKVSTDSSRVSHALVDALRAARISV